MNAFWGQIVAQIAMAFVMPLIAAAAAAAVGWIAWGWHRLFNVEFDAKSRASLQDALQRGTAAAVQAVIAQKGYFLLTDDTRAQVLSNTASYVEKWSGGAVKRFGLSHDDLMALATPHLPVPSAIRFPTMRGQVRD